MSAHTSASCHGVRHKTTAVSAMLPAVGIVSKGLSTQTMEEGGSCLVLPITMDA